MVLHPWDEGGGEPRFLAGGGAGVRTMSRFAFGKRSGVAVSVSWSRWDPIKPIRSFQLACLNFHHPSWAMDSPADRLRTP